MANDQSGLKDRIQEDMKSAMRAKDAQRLSIIRLIMAAIKQREVDERISLDDTQVLVVLDKMVKQRRDSINQYESAGRQDLADKENFEISVIQEYLPAALSEAEIDALVDEAISATNATTIKEMGAVMAQLRPRIQGRADMGGVSNKVKEKLAGTS